MNPIHKMTILLFAFVAIAASENTVKYSSEKLASLYHSIEANLHDPMAIDTVRKPDSGLAFIKLFANTVHGIPCTIKTEEQYGVITHIGLSLFNTDAQWQYNLITRFIERFFLELFEGKPAVEIEKAQTEQISITFNGKLYGKDGFSDLYLLLPVIQSPSQYIIELNKDEFNYRWFKSTWKDNNGNTVVVSFPSRWDIISGKDKREIDSALINALAQYRPFQDSVNTIDIKNMQPFKNQLYVLKGTQYFEELSSDLFYIKKSGKFVPVVDIKFPKPSIANLLLMAVKEGKHIDIDLCFKDNHDQLVHDTVPLNTLTSYFGREHDSYIGFEHETTDTIAAVIVYVNKLYNNIHMISINIPLSLLKSSDHSVLHAAIFPNIPNDNVTSLFGKYACKKQKKYSIVIKKSDKAAHAQKSN